MIRFVIQQTNLIMKYLLSFVLLFSSLYLFSQNDIVQKDSIIGISKNKLASHNFHFEAGGSGIGYSINYEYFLLNKRNAKIGIGMGYSYSDESIYIPQMNFLFGESDHHFESGFAVLSSKYIKGGSIRLGYRYQKPKGGVVFRAAFTPIFVSGGKVYDDIWALLLIPGVFPWGGVSIGYSF